jgi:hypothetical protein
MLFFLAQWKQSSIKSCCSRGMWEMFARSRSAPMAQLCDAALPVGAGGLMPKSAAFTGWMGSDTSGVVSIDQRPFRLPPGGRFFCWGYLIEA